MSIDIPTKLSQETIDMTENILMKSEHEDQAKESYADHSATESNEKLEVDSKNTISTSRSESK